MPGTRSEWEFRSLADELFGDGFFGEEVDLFPPVTDLALTGGLAVGDLVEVGGDPSGVTWTGRICIITNLGTDSNPNIRANVTTEDGKGAASVSLPDDSIIKIG